MKARFSIVFITAVLVSASLTRLNAAPVTSVNASTTQTATAPRYSRDAWLRRHFARTLMHLQQEQLRAAQKSNADALNAIRADTAATVEQNMATVRGTSLAPVN